MAGKPSVFDARRIRDEAGLEGLLKINPQVRDVPGLLRGVAERGAVLEGHFSLKHRRHCRHFLRYSEIGWDRDFSRRIAEALLERRSFEVENSVVLCSEAVGMFLGRAVAEVADVRLAACPEDRNLALCTATRPYELKPGDSVTLVTDFVTTGRTIEHLWAVAKEKGAKVRGLFAFAALADSGIDKLATEYDLRSTWLAIATWEAWPADECKARCPSGSIAIPASELT